MTATRTIASGLFAAVLVFGVSIWWRGPSAAYACSIGSYGTPERQVAVMLEALEGSELVIAGRVMEERSLGTLTNGPGKNDVYESSVRAGAVLRGESPGEIVRVGQLGYDDKFCSGGPRLREGETVLLALDRGFIEGDGAAVDASVWRIHHLGKVLVHEGRAVSQYANTGLEVGPADALIRAYSEALGSEPEQVEQAIAAIAGDQPSAGGTGTSSSVAERGDDGPPGWLIAGVAVVVLAGIGGLYWRRRRGGQARPG